jgi:hypothetical protein
MPRKAEKLTKQILVRVSASMVAAIDEWRRGQFDLPTRADAFRRLAGQALKQAGFQPEPTDAEEDAKAKKVEKKGKRT